MLKNLVKFTCTIQIKKVMMDCCENFKFNRIVARKERSFTLCSVSDPHSLNTDPDPGI